MKTVSREYQNAKRCIILRKGKEQRELSDAKHSDGETGRGSGGVKKAREDGLGG